MQIYYNYKRYKFLLLIKNILKKLKVLDSSFLLKLTHILLYANKFLKYTNLHLMLNEYYS